MSEPLLVKRRGLLRRMLEGLGAVGAVLLGAPILRSLLPPPSPPESRQAAVSADEISIWDSRLLLVDGRPAILVHTPQGYTAFSAVCTHLGCTVRWRRWSQEFFCPCHGGRFGLDGRVIGGPPRAPLRPLEVESTRGRVVVRSV